MQHWYPEGYIDPLTAPPTPVWNNPYYFKGPPPANYGSSTNTPSSSQSLPRNAQSPRVSNTAIHRSDPACRSPKVHRQWEGVSELKADSIFNVNIYNVFIVFPNWMSQIGDEVYIRRWHHDTMAHSAWCPGKVVNGPVWRRDRNVGYYCSCMHLKFIDLTFLFFRDENLKKENIWYRIPTIGPTV